MDQSAAFEKFKSLCADAGYLENNITSEGDDITAGINDDGTLHRFFRARAFNPENAFQQYSTTQKWRTDNRLIELYDSIDVSDYEATRKMYTHWIGRRDRKGSPICLFEIQQLTPSVMAAYTESCVASATKIVTNEAEAEDGDKPQATESEATLRLFCTYENLVRFVLPLCSAIPSRSDPTSPITDTTCIVDITGVSLMQFWRLRSHMQAASALATAHYPETLGITYVLGAPSYFSTIWNWLGGWFDANTMSKIRIVPPGQELAMLSESIDPVNIPEKYGGKFPFDFGMPPKLDDEIKRMVTWLSDENKQEEEAAQEFPFGPMRWVERAKKKRTALAVGTIKGTRRNMPIMGLP